jgi:prepilin-type N-terminal cleavage/methylation domain-containing protein
MVKNHQKSKGFTIIEVLIVLAIAGVILITVLAAMHQLRVSVNDSHRKTVAANVKAEIDSYAANHLWVYPFSSNDPTYPHGAVDCIQHRTGCFVDFVNLYIKGTINVNDPSTGDPMVTGADFQHGLPIEWPDPPSPTIQDDITKGQFYIVYGARCNGSGVMANNSPSPKSHGGAYAVVVGLERDGTAMCIDNS